MLRLKLLILFTIALIVNSTALASGHDKCLECHSSDEFADFSAAEIAADVRDPAIPPHQKLAELSDADVAAIAAELAGS